MEFPSIGELRKKVVLRKKQDAVAGDFEVATNYDAGVELWAKIEPVGGAIYYGTQQTDEKVTHRIWIRYRTGVTADHVIDHPTEARRYHVRRQSDLKGAGKFLLIEAEELRILSGN